MNKFLVLIICFLFCPVFVSAQGCVDINTATLEQLKEITQIGDARAQAIIDARPFSSVDNLSKVKGIGSGTKLQKIKDQGLACVDCGSTQNFQLPISNFQSNPNSSGPQNGKTAENGSPPITYPRGIFINEILPNPQGEDSLEEWIVSTIQQTHLACL